MLYHCGDALFDGIETASGFTSLLNSEAAVVVGFGEDGCAIVKPKPSGLDNSLAESYVASDSVALSDGVEGLGDLAVERRIVLADVLVHFLYVSRQFSAYGYGLSGPSEDGAKEEN